jgi:ABC-type sugar transport system ATPase subunit
MNADSTLRVEGIRRSFGAVHALRGVSMTVASGEVTALVGDNGAGKSTLVKIICGVDQPDDGELFLGEVRTVFANPGQAQASGIEAVHQDLALAPDLDAAMNLFLGRETLRRGWPLRRLDRAAMHRRTTEVLRDLQVNVPSTTVAVGRLSGGQRQAVAVARAAMWAKAVVILDEPTAALGVRETEAVLQLIERIRREAKLGVLLISHSLPEVFRVSDRIVVMRHGSVAATLMASATTMEEVVAFMTGSARTQ